MVQRNPLNTIIRFVDANYKITSPEERVIVIDATSKKAISVIDLQGKLRLERRSVTGSFHKRKYVLVVNTDHGRKAAEGKISKHLYDFSRQWTLPLEVTYLVSVSHQNEAKVGQVLGCGENLEAELNNHIIRWIDEYAGPNPGLLIEKFYERQADLQIYLATQARNEIGLNLQALVNVEGEQEMLQAIRLNALCFLVRVSDYHEEQGLKLDAEVGVYDPLKVLAVVNHSSWFQVSSGVLKEPVRLEELIKFETRKFFKANIPLNQFLLELQSAKLGRELTEQLNTALRPYGREISTLSLNYKDKIYPDVQPFLERKKEVSVTGLQEYEFPVSIKSSVQMTMRDYALYRLSGSQNPDAWLDKNLTQVVNDVLFGKRYLDLLIGFDPLKSEIKEKLSQRAEKIGYSIKQLITVPNLPQYTWLENIPIEIDSDQSSFETKTPKFAVNLGIYVDAKIRSLRDVESYLNRNQEVPDLMKQTVVNETRKLLHAIEPERFYMRFSYADPTRDETKSVEEMLSDRIRESLEAKFNADVTHITIKMLDTDLTKIWSDLERGEGGLDIRLPSLSDVEGVTYVARVRVDAIHENGWDRFRTTRPNITRVCQSLALHVSARLGSFASLELAYTNLEAQLQIEQMIEQLAKKFAVEEFGLVIRVNSIHRIATNIEKGEKGRIKEMLDAIAKLERERLAEITNHGSPARIQAIADRIRDLKAELPDTVKATIDKYSRPEIAGAAGPSRLGDYGRLVKSLGPGDNNGHDNANTENTNG